MERREGFRGNSNAALFSPNISILNVQLGLVTSRMSYRPFYSWKGANIEKAEDLQTYGPSLAPSAHWEKAPSQVNWIGHMRLAQRVQTDCCYGLNCILQKRCAEVLTLASSECDLI